jgi:hypothetical protein
VLETGEGVRGGSAGVRSRAASVWWVPDSRRSVHHGLFPTRSCVATMCYRVLHLLSLLACALAQGHVTDYAPQTNVQCPNTSAEPLLRVFTPQTQALHPQEIAYINTRESTVIPAAWQDWLGDGSGIGYNLSTFGASFPRVGIAISGGGLRASQYGASVLNALDARNATAYAAGTGGLLQVSSYMSGLSGTLSFCSALGTLDSGPINFRM